MLLCKMICWRVRTTERSEHLGGLTCYNDLHRLRATDLITLIIFELFTDMGPLFPTVVYHGSNHRYRYKSAEDDRQYKYSSRVQLQYV